MKRIKMFESFPEEDELDRLTNRSNEDLTFELYDALRSLEDKYGETQLLQAVKRYYDKSMENSPNKYQKPIGPRQGRNKGYAFNDDEWDK